MTQRGETRPNTLADDIDQLFIDGGSVEEVAERSVPLARARGFKPYTVSRVREHLKYREDCGWQLHELGNGRLRLVPPPWHRHAQSR
jgi:hypothetical protein